MKKPIFILLFLLVMPFVTAYSIDTTIHVEPDGIAKVFHSITEITGKEITIPAYSPESLSIAAKYDENQIIIPAQDKNKIELFYLTDSLTKKDKEWRFSYDSSENERVKVIMPISSRILSKTSGYVASEERTGKVFEWSDAENIKIEYEYEFREDETKIPDSFAKILIIILTVMIVFLGFVLYRNKKEIKFLQKTKTNPIQSFMKYYNLLEDNDKRIVNQVLLSPHLRISKNKLRRDIAMIIYDKKIKEKGVSIRENEKEKYRIQSQQASAQQIKRGLARLLIKSKKGKYGLFTEEDDFIEFSKDAKQDFKLTDKEIVDKIKRKIKKLMVKANE